MTFPFAVHTFFEAVAMRMAEVAFDGGETFNCFRRFLIVTVLPAEMETFTTGRPGGAAGVVAGAGGLIGACVAGVVAGDVVGVGVVVGVVGSDNASRVTVTTYVVDDTPSSAVTATATLFAPTDNDTQFDVFPDVTVDPPTRITELKSLTVGVT